MSPTDTVGMTILTANRLTTWRRSVYLMGLSCSGFVCEERTGVPPRVS
jgi:hypothetical protein